MDSEKKHNIFLVGFLLIVVGIALIISFNYNYFNETIKINIQNYGLIGVLVFSALLDVLFQPIGPEIPGIMGILLGLNLVLVFIFTIIGSMVGSIINYVIGKKYLLSNIKSFYSVKKYSKYQNFFHRYGKLAVFISAISPVPWAPFCWMAGTFHMKFWQYTLYGLIPRIFRIGVILVGIEYFYGFF